MARARTERGGAGALGETKPLHISGPAQGSGKVCIALNLYFFFSFSQKKAKDAWYERHPTGATTTYPAGSKERFAAEGSRALLRRRNSPGRDSGGVPTPAHVPFRTTEAAPQGLLSIANVTFYQVRFLTRD